MFPVFMFYEAELDQVSKFKARSDLAFMINPWLDFMTYMMTLGTILLIICFFVLLLPVKSYCKVAINFSTIIWKKRSKRVLPTDFRFPFLSVYMRWNKEVFKFFFISQCSYHRTFSGSFCYYYYYYLLYCYVRLTLKQVEK